MIYDSHCHLDLMDNMTPIVQSIAKEDVGILSVGTTPRAYLKEVEMFGDVKNIHVALGLHPQLIGSGYDDWRLFEELAKIAIISVRSVLILGKIILQIRSNK